VFILKISVTSSNNAVLNKTYPFMVTAGAVASPHSSVDTSASPTDGGTTSGDGVYTNGTTATVTATANAGFRFVNWTDNDRFVSLSTNYQFTNILNRSLVANFIPAPSLNYALQPPNTLLISWSTNFSGFSLQHNSDLATTGWVTWPDAITTVGSNYQAYITTTNGQWYFRLMHP
jgi:hypothetical protein